MHAVDRLSFDVRAGEISGLVGPDGAGKTTTLRMLAGIMPPDEGTASVGSWPGRKPTPTVDGEMLYVEGLGGDVACLQVEDGKIVWQHSLTRDYGGRVPMWSYRESPLVDGDKVIVTPGSQDATLAALDKVTGKTVWKSRMPAGSGGSPAGPAGTPGPGGFGSGPGGSGGPAGPGGRAAGPAAVVTGTKDPGLFTSEHWGMTVFSTKIPNGRYLAKLYFAETYEGITGPGQRVFSYNVQGHEFKDFDVWAKTGGRNRAYTETVPVEVTNGEFRIVFTRQSKTPQLRPLRSFRRQKR